MDTSTLTTGELMAILDVARNLAEQHMVEPLLDYVATTVFELIAAERCLIVLFDDDGGLQVQVARTRRGETIRSGDDQISRSVLDQVRGSLAPVIVNDALEDSVLKSARSVRSLGLRSVMCVPLVSHERAVGAIYVENRSAGGRFQDSNLIPLVLFASQVVVALENARMVEALEATVMERTRDVQDANARLAEQAAALQQQNAHLEQLLLERDEAFASQQRLLDVIAEISTPVLPLLPEVLALPIVGALDSVRMQRMHEQLLGSISVAQARVVLLDITGVPVVDTQVASALIQMARAARLLGCQVIMVGIRPEIAQSLVGLGVSLAEFRTHGTIADGLSTALRLTGRSIGAVGRG